MKKSMLCAGLITILCATAYAEDSGKPVNANKANAKHAKPTLANKQVKRDIGAAPARSSIPTQRGTQTATSDTIQTPATPSTQTSTTPGVQTPATSGAQTPATPSIQTPGASGAPGTQTPAAPAKPPQPLNCKYRIPAETTHIEQTVIMKWAEKAVEQSFDFDHSKIDKQLVALKSCYTEQGWQGFNDALQKSGNLNAIKSQQLMVSSMVNGQGNVIEIKDNQWKVTLPIQVVYQNDKEKLTQPLTVNLVVGRKISGDLGIMQMIAIPRQNASEATPTTTTTPSPASSATQPKQP